MEIQDLLQTLNNKAIKLGVKDEKLTCFAPKGAMTAEIAEAIKAHKATLIDMFSQGKSQNNRGQSIPLAPEDATIPLSFTQERIWFQEELSGSKNTYNIPIAFPLVNRPLDLAAMTNAVRILLSRHSILRTHFTSVDGQPVQQVSDTIEVTPKVTSISREYSESETTARNAEIKSWVSFNAQVGFDLTTEIPFRCHILAVDSNTHIILFVLHHMVSDGWSNIAIIRELSALYNACTTQSVAIAESLFSAQDIQYKDFAYWQRTHPDALESHKKQLAYWEETLADVPHLLDLPLDKPRPTVQRHEGHSIHFELSDALSDAAIQLSHTHGASLFMVLLASFHVLVARFSGKNDLALGTPLAVRNTKQLESLVGPCLNVIMMRNQLNQENNFVEFLNAVKQNALKAYDNQQVPFEQVVAALKHPRSTAYEALCQVMFLLKVAPKGEAQLEESESLAEQFGFSARDVSGFSKLDLTLMMREENGKISGWFEFNTDLFHTETIQRLAEQYIELLEALTETPEQPLAQITGYSQQTQGKLTDFSQGIQQAAPLQSVADRVSHFAEQTPDAAALIDTNNANYAELSYAQVEHIAKQLAHQWSSQYSEQFTAQSRVIIALPADPRLSLTLLALQYLRVTYITLDVENPSQRNLSIIDDAKPHAVIGDQQTLAALTDHAALPCVTIALDDSEINNAKTAQAEFTARPVQPDDTAYLLYTSGTSGKPKGVMISYANLSHYLHAAQQYYVANEANPANAANKVPFTMSPAFDASITCGLVPLFSGLAVEYGRSLSDLCTQSEAYHYIKLTPSQWDVVLEQLQEQPHVPTHQWILGGEALSPALVDTSLRLDPTALIYNEYGPTEATVGCTLAILNRSPKAASTSIGKPFVNSGIHIVNETNNIANIGHVGEIVITGAGVGQGYWQNAEQTDAAFVANRWDNLSEKAYRTGDLARFLENGELEYFGRKDLQLKVRGFRIEPAEIEAVFKQQDDIAQCAIVPLTHGSITQLHALIVTPNTALDVNALRSSVEMQLPDYMWPQQIVCVDALPLTQNGKLNTVEAARYFNHTSSAAQQPLDTPTEHTLAQLWSSLLEISVTDANADFFLLGGYSLLVIKLQFQIEKALNTTLSTADLFRHSRLKDMAALVDENQQSLATTEDDDTESLMI